MPCDNRLRIMGDASLTFKSWKEDVDKLKANLISNGLTEEQATEKALTVFPKPINPYQKDTMRYEFWYTGFRNAELDS